MNCDAMRNSTLASRHARRLISKTHCLETLLRARLALMGGTCTTCENSILEEAELWIFPFERSKYPIDLFLLFFFSAQRSTFCWLGVWSSMMVMGEKV